jgi:hypothetical protein
MKKTSYIHLALITAALASCKTNSYQQNSSYQQNGCPMPDSLTDQQLATVQDSCVTQESGEIPGGIFQSVFESSFYVYNGYLPGASYMPPASTKPMPMGRRGKRGSQKVGSSLKLGSILRGGFGSKGKSVSS